MLKLTFLKIRTKVFQDLGIVVLKKYGRKNIGGMISGQNNNHKDRHCKPQNIELTDVVTQESVWEDTAIAAATKTQPRLFLQEMAREKNLEENGQRTMIADTALKPSILYLVLPSYAEPQKKAIKKSLQMKKQNSAAIVCSKIFLLALTSKLLFLTAKI